MNRAYVVEHNLVERYLRDELSDEEIADFEAFYMDDPETLDELEAAQILLSQKKMPEAVRGEPAVSGDFSAAGGAPAKAARNPWQWISGALAAALVVAVVFPLNAPRTGYGNVQDIRLESLRNNDSRLVIAVEPESQAVLIRIPVPVASGAYQLSVKANGASFMQDSLVRDSYGEISVVVPREFLGRSDEFQVEVRSGEQIVVNAAVRVDLVEPAS